VQKTAHFQYSLSTQPFKVNMKLFSSKYLELKNKKIRMQFLMQWPNILCISGQSIYIQKRYFKRIS